MSVNDQYALNWNNHTTHIKKSFDSLLSAKEFVDVTLACEGKKVTAHKIVLSACSTYFHDLFKDNPCQHPIVILKDVKYQHLTDILKFIYNGEVSVAIDTFDSFLKTAEFLQISGLTDDEGQISTADSIGMIGEILHVSSEAPELIPETKPIIKTEHVDKLVTRRSEKSKDTNAKRKTIEKPVETSPVTKRRRENANVKEAISLKKEETESLDDVQPVDPLDISHENHDDTELFTDTENSGVVQHSTESQKFNDVQDLLIEKTPKGSKAKLHKLEERIGKLEASRSYCKGCFLRTRMGHITKDKIKRVNTFCPGCDGLPNYCKPCFLLYHKKMKNVARD